MSKYGHYTTVDETYGLGVQVPCRMDSKGLKEGFICLGVP